MSTSLSPRLWPTTPTTASSGSGSGAYKRALPQPHLLGPQPACLSMTEGLPVFIPSGSFPNFCQEENTRHGLPQEPREVMLGSRAEAQHGPVYTCHSLGPASSGCSPSSGPLLPSLCACSWVSDQLYTIEAGFLQEGPPPG